MTDLEKVELAMRRVAGWYSTGGHHDADLLATAFELVANEIARIIKDYEGNK